MNVEATGAAIAGRWCVWPRGQEAPEKELQVTTATMKRMSSARSRAVFVKHVSSVCKLNIVEQQFWRFTKGLGPHCLKFASREKQSFREMSEF